MLARGAAPEISPRDKDRCARVARLVEHELNFRCAVRLKAPIVEQELPEPGTLNALQELLGDDLVGVNIGAVQRRCQSGMHAKRLHVRSSLRPEKATTDLTDL